MTIRIRVTSVIISASLLLVPALALAAFDQDLRQGNRGSAVLELQQFLIGRGLLAPDNATGFFGPLTLGAVKVFQSSQGVQPVSGFFGPLTRGRANALLSDNTPMSSTPETISSLTAQIAGLLQKVQQLQTQVEASRTSNPPPLPDTSSKDFSASPISGSAPLTVKFSSMVGGGLPPGSSIVIRYGDRSSDTPAPCVGSAVAADSCGSPGINTHIYTSPGTYTAQLVRISCIGTGCEQVWATATITVTTANKCGLNTFSVSNECGAGEYRNVSVQCYDGHMETLGGPTSCKPTATWRAYADAHCANRCSTTTAGSFSASPTSGTAPLNVIFTAGITMSPGLTVDFGDGAAPQSISLPLVLCQQGGACIPPAPSVSHYYASPGIYEAKLLGPCDLALAPASGCMSERPILGTATITVTQ